MMPGTAPVASTPVAAAPWVNVSTPSAPGINPLAGLIVSQAASVMPVQSLIVGRSGT
jgi:hypothetical protein